ncbi:MAG: YkgJ family cysteine cluster protein [Desulfotignum sp.]|nr:YkgJ family cysteine cluster protein [Desulfotignum sp.]
MTGGQIQKNIQHPAMENRVESWTFLTRAQAIDAIAIDFQAYCPQPDLFRCVAPLILGNRCNVRHPNKHAGVWILQGNAFYPVADQDLGFYLIHVLETATPDLETLAEICALVFQTRTCAGYDKTKNISGIWILSQMDTFVCRQCGKCCRTLAYETGCTRTDYSRWQDLDRQDILAWVCKETENSKTGPYRIWVNPDTGKTARTCPWLAPCPEENRFLCTIHDLKPSVCRQYPYTKKHAVMTGCKGVFATESIAPE